MFCECKLTRAVLSRSGQFRRTYAVSFKLTKAARSRCGQFKLVWYFQLCKQCPQALTVQNFKQL